MSCVRFFFLFRVVGLFCCWVRLLKYAAKYVCVCVSISLSLSLSLSFRVSIFVICLFVCACWKRFILIEILCVAFMCASAKFIVNFLNEMHLFATKTLQWTNNKNEYVSQYLDYWLSFRFFFSTSSSSSDHFVCICVVHSDFFLSSKYSINKIKYSPCIL